MMAFLAILLSAFLGCSRQPGTENARAVKLCVLDDIADDTTAYVRQLYLYIDSLPLSSESDCDSLYEAVNRLTYDMHYHGKDARAVVLLRKILDIFENAPTRSLSDTRQMLKTHIRLGASFSDMGMPALSMDYYTSGLEYCRDTVFDVYKAMFNNNLAIIYAQRELYDKADSLFNAALRTSVARRNYDDVFMTLANLTELYALQGRTEKALEVSQESLDYIDRKRHPENLARMRIQQGILYSKLHQYDLAMIRYNTGLKQYRALKDYRGLNDALLNISKLYLDNDQRDSAMAYAMEAFAVCRSNQRYEDMVATLGTLARIHRANGDLEQALTMTDEMNRLSDSLRNAESRMRLNNWTEEIGSTALRPVSSKAVTPWGTVIILSLAGALLLVIVFYFKKRREAAAGREQMRKECQGLNADIDRLNRELTSQSLERLKLHEGLTDAGECIRTVLTELSPREIEKRETLRSLLSRVSNMASFDADEEFRIYFERIHPDFYRILSEKFPELTPRDLRLCAFLHMGMTTKEIAVLTYREVRSVDSARNRLRKKLNLDLSDDLTAYLRSIV